MRARSPNADKRYPTADAMLEDLERFRKDPDVDLDYIRADLCEAADSEPTQPISVAEVTAAHGLKKAAAAGKAKSAADEEAEEKKSEKKKMAIIIGAFAAVLLIAFLIFQVVGSINKNPGTESHTVPNVLGYTVEQAEQLDGREGCLHDRGHRHPRRQQVPARPDRRAGSLRRPHAQGQSRHPRLCLQPRRKNTWCRMSGTRRCRRRSSN